MTTDADAALGAMIRAAIREEVAAQLQAVADAPEHLMAVESAAQALGISRSLAFQEIRSGRLTSCKVGRRRLVPASAITAYIDRLGRP
jgi:excisionase family DNA binding protein